MRSDTARREEIISTIESEIAAEMTGIEEKVMSTSLADLIRMGSKHTTQEFNWGAGDTACALSAAAYGAAALGVISTER